MYKYRGDNGEWIYSDRAPDDGQQAEIRTLQKGAAPPTVVVIDRVDNGTLRLVARNGYFAPVQVVLALDRLNNLELPPPEQRLRWTVAPRSDMTLIELDVENVGYAASAEYRFVTIIGDPESSHSPTQPYRAPFAVASDFPVTQAYPVSITHVTPDSYYAVDFAMPIGTNVYAARGGTVFDVSSTNFRGGLDPDRDLAAANIVRILHDDGTYAVYAHLNWNSIRVRPGDTVERGEYIADSGNTGFSSGPHLHFAVMRNKDMGTVSVPVTFAGPNNAAVQAETGTVLVAY